MPVQDNAFDTGKAPADQKEMADDRIQKRKRTHKRAVICIAALAVLILFCHDQNKHLTVTFYSYESEKLATEFDGFRIVQISDLHNAVFGRGNKRLLQKLSKLQPDLVVLTGDLVDSNRTNIETAVAFAGEAAKLCPVYYVTGNHENFLSEEKQAALFDGLSDAGVTVLFDGTAEITKGEASFLLIGLRDEHLSDSTLQTIVSQADSNDMLLLLAHEPQYLEAYSQSGVDLALTGHAHGGQFRLPGVGGLVAPDQGFFPKYTEGVHTLRNTTMIISRGLGNSIIPLRLFNYPEIVCVDLKHMQD